MRPVSGLVTRMRLPSGRLREAAVSASWRNLVIEEEPERLAVEIREFLRMRTDA